MKRPRLPRITRIQALKLEPGDVLVISTDRHVTHDEAMEIREHLRAFFGEHDSLFLPPGWSVDAVRRENLA